MIASNLKTNTEYAVYQEENHLFILLPGVKKFYLLNEMDITPDDIPKSLWHSYFIINGRVFNGHFVNKIPSDKIIKPILDLEQLSLF